MTEVGAVPTMMWAAVMPEMGKIDIVQIPTPDVAADEVLVQVASVGICGSDVHYYKEGRIGDFIVEKPLILGHELSGTIVAVGADVDPARVGERVAIEPQRCCRVCHYCKTGRYNLCPEMEFYATPPIDGAFCEYVTIQHDFAHPIPDDMSFDAAALLEPLSVGISAIRKARFEPGGSILIAGGGPIGIVTAQVARAYGATRVIISEMHEGRRELALKLGATEVYDPRDPAFADVRADSFIDCSGATSAIIDGLMKTNPNGAVVLVGMGADTIPLPVGPVANQELNVTGIFRYTTTWPLGIRLVEAGLIDLESLVTDIYRLDQAEAALVDPPGPLSLKRVVRPTEIEH